MNTRLDHIVIAATTLDQGADYVRQVLGVDIPDGGQHQMMGTHNKVMSLGQGVYLEVIAINAEMKSPDHPRWFGLDDPHIRHSLAQHPKLLTWAVNTDELDSLVGSSRVGLGEVRQAQRDNLKWKVAITEDGRMPGAGFIPLCIEWLVDFHPSEAMQSLGCIFNSLTIYHSKPRWLKECLQSIGADNLVNISQIAEDQTAYMELKVSCPRGEVTISSKA